MTQDELKGQVARAALVYVGDGQVLGVGTGSTVNQFIDALAAQVRLGHLRVPGAVSSSEASTKRLLAAGIPVLQASEVEALAVYIDGADEIDHEGHMIKGGGGALTREKIVAAMSSTFVCIADESKWVKTLGAFPLPVEVIPMAVRQVTRQFDAHGGRAILRRVGDAPWVTDNGLHILDVSGLRIADPLAFERAINQWPGVVTVGVFAQQKASVCLLGGPRGVTKHVF